MFTAYDKAIVAVIWAALSIWQISNPGTAPDVSEEQVTNWVSMVINIAGPILVYLVPNKK